MYNVLEQEISHILIFPSSTYLMLKLKRYFGEAEMLLTFMWKNKCARRVATILKNEYNEGPSPMLNHIVMPQ